MNPAASIVLNVRHYGAAPGSHAHAHAQVLWSLCGALELEIDGRGLLLPAGQAVLLLPGQRHDFQGRDGNRCLVLDTADPQWARRPARPDHPEAAHHLAAYCAHALDGPDAPPAELLAMLLARAWSCAAPAPGGRRTIDWNALARWALSNLHRPLTAADLAARALLGESQFRARCREELGCSPMQWVRSLRLERLRALRSAGLGVAEAARRAGYASPSASTAGLRRSSQPRD